MKTVLWMLVFILLATASFGRSLYKIDGNSVIVDLEGIGVKSRMLKIEVLSDKAVKIVSGMDKEFSPFHGFILQGQSQPVKFKVAYAQNNIEVTTRDLIVSMQEDGLVRIFNRDGNKLLIESDRSFEPIISNEAKYSIKQRYFLNMHENIYSSGFDCNQPFLNLRGTSFMMKQDQTAIASPVFYSEKGYAVIWDNYSKTTLNDQKSGMEISSDFADEIQYSLIYGPTWDEIVAEIRQLTGNVPMLPRWAFGHWGFPQFYDVADVQQQKSVQYNSNDIPAETNTTSDFSLLKEEQSFSASGIKERLICSPAYPSMKNTYAEKVKQTSNRRLCIPTFINYPGIQTYGTFLIEGEVNPSWESLKNQVVSSINISLSGQPYWSTLIGGVGNPEQTLQSYDELLTRWYQFASFSPIFLLPKPDRDIFVIKSVGLSDAVAKAIKLRYHLLPYIYSTDAEVYFKNKTFTRSLLFDFQKVEKTHLVDQQYLFGESMMICPVTASSVSQQPVYFPPGFVWFDFFTGKQYTGDTNASIDVTTDHIPVFVKSGSIVPFATIGSNSNDSLSSPMEIRIYPGSDAHFTLYEDANDGLGYKSEQFTIIPIDYSEKDKTVSVGSVEGSFRGMIGERLFKMVLVTDSTGIGNEMSSNFKEIVYKGKKVKVKL
jgi:alpha-glucosidase (family GH31 glycosyl hydrolase)